MASNAVKVRETEYEITGRGTTVRVSRPSRDCVRIEDMHELDTCVAFDKAEWQAVKKCVDKLFAK